MSHRAALVSSISSILRQDEPIRRMPSETAAVAVIFAEAGEREGGERILLIKRSEREGDPWSGHIAFPGGRVERQDVSFRGTAMRETLEEVGIDLDAASTFVGYLDAFQARTRGIWVVPSIFLTNGLQPVKPSSEVSSHKWVAFDRFLAPEGRSTFEFRSGTQSRTFPAFEVDDYLVWGLTERILSALADAMQEAGKSAKEPRHNE